MDPFDQLLDLRQGSSSIEEYVTQFCEITYKVPFDEVMLKDIFRFGLNEPIKSCLPEGKFNCSLKDFMDYTLLCAGSSFTEERDSVLRNANATAQNALTKWRRQQRTIISQLIAMSQVTTLLILQSRFTSPLIIQSHFTSPLNIQSHFTSPLTIQNLFTSPLISQSLVTFCLPHPYFQG